MQVFRSALQHGDDEHRAAAVGDGSEIGRALARRMEEQAALFAFTERLRDAGSLGDVCDAAVETIMRALRCPRAAVLLLDDDGVMRFVAWRGLSDIYRRAVEGHSPWRADAVDPEPVLIPDAEASGLAEELKSTIRLEGISAVAFIPLEEGGRLFGKFMAYFDAPHDFTLAETQLALTIARQLGLGVERVRIEAARLKAERAAQHLAAIVESSDDAIISKDLDGIITSWNRGAERIFGYAAEEAIGRPITLLIPEERLEEEPKILGKIRSGERVDHFETLRRRKDGRLIDISLTISPIRDRWGRIVGASKIARDITSRKESEAKLRQSEQHLQDLMAAIPAAIYTTDAEGRITYFNQAAVELAGRTPAIGSDEWCVTWKLYQPDGTPLPHDQCPMAVALKEGRSIRNAEAVAERPDGTRVPFIPYPTPLRDAEGRVTGAINMLVDISERKQAETQQRLLLDELNHRVKNNMQMLQSLLASAARKTESTEAKRVLAEAGERLAVMAAAQRVLYGSADGTRYEAQAFLDAVCQTAAQAFPSGLEIIRSADEGELPNDTAMPLALVLNELLTNAVKHGLGGRERGVIRVKLARLGAGMELSVEDDGPGFELGRVNGRSSGLKLVEGLARQLRGRFEVTSGEVTRCSLRFA